MAQPRASNEEFLSQLSKLIEKTQQTGHGSVFLTQKRLIDSSAPIPATGTDSLEAAGPLPVLIRVSDGDTQSAKKVKNKQHVKFSTIVQPEDLEAFFVRYADVCKSGMQSLRKRDRSKRKGKKKKATDTKT